MAPMVFLSSYMRKEKKSDPEIKIKVRLCSNMGWRKLLSHYRTNKYHQLPDTKGKRKTTGKLASRGKRSSIAKDHFRAAAACLCQV